MCAEASLPKSSDQRAGICSPKYTWKSIASSEPARRWGGCCWHPTACPLSSITARWGTSQQPSRKQSSELSPGTNSHLQQIWQRHRHLRRDTGVAASPSPTIGSLAALPPVTPSPRNGTPSSPGSCLGRVGLGCASRRGDRQRWGTQRRSRAHPWLAPHGHTGRHGLSARTPPVSRTARERRRIVFHKLIKLAERKGSSTWLQATHPSTERALLFCRFLFFCFFFLKQNSFTLGNVLFHYSHLLTCSRSCKIPEKARKEEGRIWKLTVRAGIHGTRALRARADRDSQLTLSCPVSDPQTCSRGTLRVTTGQYIPALDGCSSASAWAPRRPAWPHHVPQTPRSHCAAAPRPYSQAVGCKTTKNSAEFFTGALAWVSIVPASLCVSRLHADL